MNPYFNKMLFLIMAILLTPICWGVKLQLISPNSVDSPVFFGNTGTQIILSMNTQAQSRAVYLVRRRNPILQPKTKYNIRPPVVGDRNVMNLLYYAKIGVGTFDANPKSFKSYYLAIDTASPVIWVQCESCQKPKHHCFPQVNPPFPNSKSVTYDPLPSCLSKTKTKNTPEREGGRCIKTLVYAGNEHARVEVAYDTFTFESSTKTSGEKRKILFGCGIDQTNFWATEPTIMAGILGLSRAESSLQFQLESTSNNSSKVGLNFSYCLPPVTEKGCPTTYLRFGEDIPRGHDFRGTPLLTTPGDDETYYVKMIDIVVNNHRLKIDPLVFDINKGGVFVDTGSSMSILVKPAFEALERKLVTLFSDSSEYRRKAVNKTMPPICYDMLKSKGGVHVHRLPTITFMLQDVDLVIAPQQGFFVAKEAGLEYFCLMMLPAPVGEDDYSTVIGAYQQVNHRFVYDNSQSKLWFRRENCAMAL